MHAHKARIAVTEDREVKLRLPSDFPPGVVEVIVLASSDDKESNVSFAKTEISAEFAHRHPNAGSLGPITFSEDPTTPLNADDWGEHLI